MAIQLVSNLDIKDDVYTFKMPLTGPIVMILGDSGIGKTLYYRTAQEQQKLKNAAFQSVIFYNHLSNFSALRKELREEYGKIFVVDNADLLLDRDSDIELLDSTQNQIILFGRMANFLGIPMKCRAYMKNKGYTFWLRYLQ